MIIKKVTTVEYIREYPECDVPSDISAVDGKMEDTRKRYDFTDSIIFSALSANIKEEKRRVRKYVSDEIKRLEHPFFP